MAETTWTQSAGMVSDEDTDNLQSYADQAEASKDAAAVSATAAEAAKVAAAASEAAALASKNSAATSATTATTGAATATTKASEAAASATSASTSATGAQTARTAAEAAETAAAASETASAASAAAASTSETNAASSASAASTSATNAGTSETNAATSASAADTSETNAAASETAASASETNAAASETAAATSESNAASSASASSTSASNAATSESNAASSASAASTSEANSAASETAAATSETNAATSASAAATSASEAAASAASFNPDSIDINGGTIDGTVIGGSTPAAGSFTNTKLAAIAESKAVTAVDVFVYDTAKDSDGGAWRKRTQGTSWYNETLNTATRGSRREFPAVAVIVAESNKVTIYDGDDASLPMWIVEDYTGLTLNAVAMANGQASIATTVGLILSDYVGDNLGSTTPNYTTTTSPAIVDNTVNDVAMTVLPNAPIDPATGLPVPTIACATNGGVSVIKDDGTVVDITFSTYSNSQNIEFDDKNKLIFSADSSAKQRMVHVYEIPSADISDGTGLGKGANALEHYQRHAIGGTSDISFFRWSPSLGLNGIKAMPNNTLVLSDPLGIVILKRDSITPSNGVFDYTTSTYSTGWMNGSIKGAFLSDTDDTDLVGGTDNDRSVNNNGLTVNGTVTRSPVATGADLVAYSGFSASNYLEQPYNSDLDFGTGDYCVAAWVKATDDSAYLWQRDDSASTGAFFQCNLGSGNITVGDTGGTNTVSVDVGDDAWHLVCQVRRDGNLHLYIDGVDQGSVASVSDLDNATATFSVGVNAASGGTSALDLGSLALLRVSATAPTASQIAKTYNDEKVLFQENAQATLYGTSDAVTALAHDPDTDLLHVGTSAGRSVFQGLRRVDNTTTAVGTAISASHGLVVEE